jgi:hypothetical protein
MGKRDQRMKLIRSFILVGAALTLAASAAFAAPRIVIPETTFNFGYVPQNSKIAHVFWLYSQGEDTLQILKVVPG